MTTKELEQAIHAIVKELYHAEYTKLLKVEKVGESYILKLGMLCPERPIQIAGQFRTDQDFLDYVRDELLNRNLIRTHYYTGVKFEPEDKP